MSNGKISVEFLPGGKAKVIEHHPVMLGPNPSVSSFTPYNQQFLPSQSDSVRRQHDIDDYHEMHDDDDYTPSAPRVPSAEELAVSGLIAAKMAKVTDVSWWGIFKTWFILHFIFPLFKLISLLLLLAIVGGVVLLGYVTYNGGIPWKLTSLSSTPATSNIRDVTPTAEVYRAQQEDREKGLTPVKPTPSYGANSVFDQQAALPAPVQPAPAQPAYEQRAAAPPSRNLNFEYYCNNPKGVRMEHVQWCERLLRQQYYRGDYGYSGYYSARRGY